MDIGKKAGIFEESNLLRQNFLSFGIENATASCASTALANKMEAAMRCV
jgi:hypothetical protein